MAGQINVEDLPPDVRERLGLAPKAGNGEGKKRTRSMSQDEVRTAALRVMAVVAGLTKAERGRVLRHALKVNEV